MWYQIKTDKPVYQFIKFLHPEFSGFERVGKNRDTVILRCPDRALLISRNNMNLLLSSSDLPLAFLTVFHIVLHVNCE